MAVEATGAPERRGNEKLMKGQKDPSLPRRLLTSGRLNALHLLLNLTTVLFCCLWNFYLLLFNSFEFMLTYCCFLTCFVL